MTESKTPEMVAGVRLFSLLLAGLIWLCVYLERPGDLKLVLPVALEHQPVGLTLTTLPPRSLEITVSGPRILLLRPFVAGARCVLDLTEAKPGTTSYSALDCSFGLDRELKVVRAHPGVFQLSFSAAGK